jgi:hypothetical protein
MVFIKHSQVRTRRPQPTQKRVVGFQIDGIFLVMTGDRTIVEVEVEVEVLC